MCSQTKSRGKEGWKLEGGTSAQGREERKEDAIPVYGSLLAAISGYALAPIHHPSTTHPTNLTPSASFRSLFHQLLSLSLSLSPSPSYSFAHSPYLSLFLSRFLFTLLLSASPPPLLFAFPSATFYVTRLDIIAEHCTVANAVRYRIIVRCYSRDTGRRSGGF